MRINMGTKKLLLISCLALCGCRFDNGQSLHGYIEGLYTYVSPAIGGRLEELRVSRGDIIAANSLLFILDQQPEVAQLNQVQSNLNQAQETLVDLQKGQRQTIIDQLKAQRDQVLASLSLDKITLERYTNLYSKGAIDKNTLDTAATNYQRDMKKIKEIDANLAEASLGARENKITAQKAIVAAAVAETTQAKWALAQKTKYAPISGQIFDTYYRVGEFVPAGQPVLSILAPGNVKLIFFIPEASLSKIKIGQTIKFGCDSCKTKYSAIISFVSSKAEYTPPVIYSRESRTKLVYRVEAKITPEVATMMHAGQPVDVFLGK